MKKLQIILYTLFSISVVAQVRLTSLQDVINYADKHAAAIQASLLQQQIDESKLQQSKSFLYPSINAISGFNDNLTIQPTLVPAKLFDPTASDDAFEEMNFGKQYTYNLGIQAQWDILDFQKIFAKQTAEMQLNADMLNTEKTKYAIYNQLASTYYSILLTSESIKIYKENLEVTKVLLRNAKEKYDKGIISELDINQISIKHLQNEKNLENADNNFEQLKKQLQSQLNTEEELVLSGSIESVIITQTHFTTIHPEILLQEKQLRIAESVLKQTKSLYYPTLSLMYQYNYNWATNSFMGFSSSNQLPSQVLGVKLNIPVFNGFLTKAKINESKGLMKIQELQLENLKIIKAKEDETLELQYQQTDNNLEKSKQILLLQMKNDEHTENLYQSGIISIDDRMNKYEDLLTAQNNFLQSLADYALVQYKIYIRQINYQTKQK